MGTEIGRIAQLGRSKIMECILGWGAFAVIFIISWIGQRVQKDDCE